MIHTLCGIVAAIFAFMAAFGIGAGLLIRFSADDNLGKSLAGLPFIFGLVSAVPASVFALFYYA